MKKYLNLKKIPTLAFSIISILLLFISFTYGVIAMKYKIFPINLTKKIIKKTNIKTNSDHEYWVNQIKKGGYILHIRHAQREKWSTNVAYDSIELLNNLDARNTTFSRAVCLTEKGIEDSKLINEVFQTLKISISNVVSSPSCRARETAMIAFSRIDRIEPSLLHRTAIMKKQHKDMGRKLREVVNSLELNQGKNIILSGHGGTLSYDYRNKVGIIDTMKVVNVDDRLETGIIVIEKVNDKYIARHKFNNIRDIAVNGIKLQINDNSNGKFLWDIANNNAYNPSNVKSGYLYDYGD